LPSSPFVASVAPLCTRRKSPEVNSIRHARRRKERAWIFTLRHSLDPEHQFSQTVVQEIDGFG
jgi:hypothetical protein